MELDNVGIGKATAAGADYGLSFLEYKNTRSNAHELLTDMLDYVVTEESNAIIKRLRDFEDWVSAVRVHVDDAVFNVATILYHCARAKAYVLLKE